MATLKSTFVLQDRYSRAVDSIMRTTRNAEAAMMGASAKADNLGQSFDKMSNKASGGAGGIKKLLGALGGFMAVKKAIDLTDEYTNTVARLSLINDGLQTQKELQDQIYLSAQRSRGEYITTAQTVAKLGMMAGEAFGSTDEIVKFTELINKSFKVGGASKTEQSAGMYQLAQAMASGRLQGDEFRSISENAPMIGKALQQHLGVGAAKLKEMSSEGLITADVIKGAMFGMGEEINTMFEQIPMTFADAGTQIKNHAIKAFEGVMEKLSEINNSDFMSTLVNVVTTGIDILAVAFLGIANIVQFVTGVITENWDLIAAILIALAIMYLPMVIARMWDLVTTLAAQALGWALVNWQIVLIFASIALLIYILSLFGVTAGDVVGFVCGIFMTMYALLYNIVAGLFNAFAIFAEFLLNCFVNPIAAIKVLFYEMAIYVLNLISAIAKKIEWLVNLIPGVEISISSGLDNLVANLEQSVAETKSEKGLADLGRMEYKDLGASYNQGFNYGNNLVSGIGDLFSGMTPSASCGGFGSMGDLGDYMSNGALPVTNGNGSGGSLNVSIDKEDLKYLKDIAERDYRAEYTQATLAPNIQITFGDVHENADADKVSKIIEKILTEEIAVVSEG